MNRFFYTYLCFLLLIASRSFAFPFAYVPNSSTNSNSVTVFDVATNSVVKTITSVGSKPTGLAITPDGGTIYVASTMSNSIEIINAATNTIINILHLPSGSSPFAIAITPDGKTAYISNSGNGTVVPLDIASNTFGTPILVGTTSSAPANLAITPDGTTVYVPVDQTVTLIDIATNTVKSVINTDIFPFWIAITSNGKTAYAVGGTEVIAIDTTSNQIVATIPAVPAATSIAITPDGKTGYVTDGINVTGTVTIIDIASNTKTGTIITNGNHPYAIAITPDQTTAYVTNFFGQNVTPIILATNTIRTPVQVAQQPSNIAITPISPPSNLKAKQKNNRFAFENEFFNKLSWTGSSFPSVVLYRIYRNGKLVGETTGLTFVDHNVEKDHPNTYKVSAVLSTGGESFFGAFLVFP